MAERILIIDPDIAFTLPLKRALENLGDFEIRTVTRLRPAVFALESTRNATPYSIAIVDTALEQNSAAEVIDALRAIQPDLPIILTSRRTDHADYRTALKTQAFLRKPYPATILASLIRSVAAQGLSAYTAETRLHVPEGATDGTPEPRPEEIIEPLLEASQQVASYLSEPPIDVQEDTIGQVIQAALEPEISRHIHAITEEHDVEALKKQQPPAPLEIEGVDEAPTPAKEILLDTSSDEALDNLIQGIRHRAFPQFEPPPVDLSATGEIIVKELPAPETLPVETPRIPRPQHLPDQYWIDTHGKEVPDFEDSQFVRTTVEEFTAQLRAFETGIEAAAAPEIVPDDVLSHYALQLTQFALESSAAGTILTRKNQILAKAGSFDTGTWDLLLLAINDAWTRKGDANTRIIYRHLLNDDLLLYSIKTTDNLILTLIFSTDTPLKNIRRQASRLSESLRAVPPPLPPSLPPDSLLIEEVAPPTEAKKPVIRPVGTYVGYACVWLLEDNTLPISQQGAQAIESGLRKLCDEQDWDFQKIDVQADWLAFHVNVPVSTLPSTLIDTLMQNSEESLRQVEPQRTASRVWSDGYLITTPPQDLTEKDIHRFIRFYRREKVGNGRA